MKQPKAGEVQWASLWTDFANCLKQPRTYNKNVHLAHHDMHAQEAMSLSEYAVCMQQSHCGIGPSHVNNTHMTVCKIINCCHESFDAIFHLNEKLSCFAFLYMCRKCCVKIEEVCSLAAGSSNMNNNNNNKNAFQLMMS